MSSLCSDLYLDSHLIVCYFSGVNFSTDTRRRWMMSPNPLGDLPSVDDMLGKINDTRERMETDEEFYKSLTDPHPSGNPMTLGRRIPTPEEMTDLQVQGAQNNADKWLKRVTNPKKNFKEEALKQTTVDRYNNSMQKVISEDRFRGGMANVNESETIDIIKAGGSGVYSGGVARRKAKILRVHKELDSDRLALASEVDGMPVATDGDREAKMIANKRGLQAIGKKRRGG